MRRAVVKGGRRSIAPPPLARAAGGRNAGLLRAPKEAPGSSGHVRHGLISQPFALLGSGQQQHSALRGARCTTPRTLHRGDRSWRSLQVGLCGRAGLISLKPGQERTFPKAVLTSQLFDYEPPTAPLCARACVSADAEFKGHRNIDLVPVQPFWHRRKWRGFVDRSHCRVIKRLVT